MNSSSNQNQSSRARALVPVLLIAALLVLAGAALVRADLAGNSLKTPRVRPPNSTPYDKTYAEWSAAWWKWGLELPVADHPFSDSTNIDFSAGQSGPVWFLAATGGPSVRTVTIPAGKAPFVALINSECSSLEAAPFHGDTAAQQAACATAFSDHIIDVFCEIDGVAVRDIQNYRFVSPQYSFTAPTPWIFGDVGGAGTSVGDGFYVMLTPLSKGQHTLHFGGTFHFPPEEGGDSGIDTTYHITVE